MISSLERLEVLSSIPGRVRFHLPDRKGAEAFQTLEAQLSSVNGVKRVQANPLTGNVLVCFDSRIVGMPAILAALRQQPEPGSEMAAMVPARITSATILRVGIRGFLGHAMVDSLWFGAGFLGRRLGLPLAASLGPLHVLMDVLVWSAVLASTNGKNTVGALRDPRLG